MFKLKILYVFLSLFISLSCFGQTDYEKSRRTEVWEPEPAIVDPGNVNKAPSDAIVLFDGKNLNEWLTVKDDSPAKWKVENNTFTVVKKAGNIKTKRKFGSCQLHIEWKSPEEVSDEGQGRGNSGIFFMEQYEVQILDSYENRTYSNGQAASVYKQHIPLVNATRAPGEWQVYDIIFTAPEFNVDGMLKSPAYFSVLHNGVLVQNHVEVKGKTLWIGDPFYEKHETKLPIILQDHGNPVSFRNIWIREL